MPANIPQTPDSPAGAGHAREHTPQTPDSPVGSGHARDHTATAGSFCRSGPWPRNNPQPPDPSVGAGHARETIRPIAPAPPGLHPHTGPCPRSKRSKHPLRPREFFPNFPEIRKKIRNDPFFKHDFNMLTNPSAGHAAPPSPSPGHRPHPLTLRKNGRYSQAPATPARPGFRISGKRKTGIKGDGGPGRAMWWPARGCEAAGALWNMLKRGRFMKWSGDAYSWRSARNFWRESCFTKGKRGENRRQRRRRSRSKNTKGRRES